MLIGIIVAVVGYAIIIYSLTSFMRKGMDRHANPLKYFSLMIVGSVLATGGSLVFVFYLIHHIFF